jgi:ribosomal protein S13
MIKYSLLNKNQILKILISNKIYKNCLKEKKLKNIKLYPLKVVVNIQNNNTKNVIPAIHFFKKYLINSTRDIYSFFFSLFGLNHSLLKKIFLLFFFKSKKIFFDKYNFLKKKLLMSLFLTLMNYLVILEYEMKLKFNKSLISILKLKSIKSMRLRIGLPVRGQRTRNNAKTSKKKLFLSYFINLKKVF